MKKFTVDATVLEAAITGLEASKKAIELKMAEVDALLRGKAKGPNHKKRAIKIKRSINV